MRLCMALYQICKSRVMAIKLVSVVVNLLFYVPPIVCGGSVLVFVFGMHYFVSFLVLQSP